jgi:cyclohexa-1,5-dienecarbonyl-CoA hydratase
MPEQGKLIRYAVQEDIGHITLCNPPMNILSQAMMDQISEVLVDVAAGSTLKALAIAAEGKAFSAGADVGEHRPDRVHGMIGSFTRMFQLFDALPLPVVMAIDGAALGAGFELALMADILVASERATFGQPEIRLGFFAPVGVVELPARVGRAKALEITCTGRTYSALEMAQCGLVSQLVPAGELAAALQAVLKDLRRASPLVMRLNVKTLKEARHQPFEKALARAEKVFLEELMVAEDPVEGIDSFYQKRRPVWKNR